MKYLTGEEILVLHSKIIDETGGLHGIRDTGLFLSIIEKPKMEFGGKEPYVSVFVKAAVYLEAFANYHVFVDGNKRTGFASAARFLFLNNYTLLLPNPEVVKFIMKVVNEKLELKEIANWLKRHSKKIK
ncbi:MAG: type II toxin-antitoxin system death-on-curing family toxin [Candidatus Doudnabacteria bacterium]|nr:type II toxin-antitoxin system death-on-curing family toxin [Candidatus Doudnabacteria bacterium]